MTSKISFSKLVWDEFKKQTWLTALTGLIFGLLIPFRVLVVMAMESQRYTDQTNVVSELSTIFWSQIGFGHMGNTLFILGAGALGALCAFGYVHSSVRLDFYHSLPMRREVLFGVKVLGSVLTFVFPYVICQLLGLMTGALYGVLGREGALEVLGSTAQGILFYLVSYGASLLALMLTGKMLTTICAIGVFGCYIPMIYLLKIILTDLFFQTSMTFSMDTAIETGVMMNSSPWVVCIRQDTRWSGNEAGVTGYLPGRSDISVLLLMIAVLFLASLLIYRIRRTERAGCALAFAKTEAVIKLLLVIPSAVAAGVIGYVIFESTIGALVFVVLFGLIFCMIMELIYRWDIRQVLAHKAQAAAAILAASLIFIGFRYDLTGYNSYLPAQDEIASMAIQDSFHTYGYLEDGNILTDNCRVLDLLETEEFEPIYRLAASGVEIEKHADVFKTEYEYSGNYCYVFFKYHLKNGKEVYREYRVSYDQLIECMDELLADQTYRERYFPILTMDASDFLDVDVYFDFVNEISELEAYQNNRNDSSGETGADEFLVQTEESDAAEQMNQTEESDAAEQMNQTEETGADDVMDQNGETDEETQMNPVDEPESEELFGQSGEDEEDEEDEYESQYSEESWSFIGQDLEDFLTAYQEDLREASFADCLYTLGTVSLWRKEVSGEYDYYNWAMTYPLNANFTRSLKLLRQNI